MLLNRDRLGKFVWPGSILLAAVLLAGACFRNQTPAPRAVPVWTHYRINAGVFDIAFQGTQVWVATDRGLVRYDLVADRITQVYNRSNGLPSEILTLVRIGPKGHIWVGSHGGGLSEFDGKSWRTYTVPDLADPYVYDLLFAPDGKMWVANWKGVSFFDGKTWKSFTKSDGIADEWVYALARDADGAMWFGTEGGVTRYDGKTFVSYNHNDGIGADLSKIGNYQRIPNPSFHHMNTAGKEAEGYNPNYILAAAVDHQNDKWFGTWGAGLTRFDGKSWTTYTDLNGLPGNFVSDIRVDADGSVWVATEGGIARFKDGRWEDFTSREGLIDDAVFAVSIDGAGMKWFGTLSGISRLDGFQTPS
jgi:ligand-binding sensor domain-containing protein